MHASNGPGYSEPLARGVACILKGQDLWVLIRQDDMYYKTGDGQSPADVNRDDFSFTTPQSDTSKLRQGGEGSVVYFITATDNAHVMEELDSPFTKSQLPSGFAETGFNFRL